MTKQYRVPIGWFRAILAIQVALGGVLLGWLMLRWPVAAGVVLALAVAVSVAMLVCIYQIVTSGHQVKPVAPVRDAAATVDGRPVKEVTVLR